MTRFPGKAHFASWNGTAPIDASSGDQVRHRLSRAGNRQINRTLHIMAIVQLRNRAARAAPTTTAKSPPARHRWKRCDASSAGCLMSSTSRWSRRPGAGSGPGRTPGGGYWLQRGRLAPRCRHFGEVTSRAATSDPTPARPAHFSGRSAAPAPRRTAAAVKRPSA